MMGPKAAAAVPALREALANGPGWWIAAQALGEIGSPEAVAALKEALKHEDADVRRTAARMLDRIEKTKVVEGKPFELTLDNGKSYRITPNLTKLQELGNLVFRFDRSLSLEQQFEKRVRERVVAESKRNRNLDVKQVVFDWFRARDPSGKSFPPMEFRVGDYAKVEERR